GLLRGLEQEEQGGLELGEAALPALRSIAFSFRAKHELCEAESCGVGGPGLYCFYSAESTFLTAKSGSEWQIIRIHLGRGSSQAFPRILSAKSRQRLSTND